VNQPENTPVNVHIMDKEFRIACSDEERENLLAAARYLDDKMKEIRRGGKVIGADRIAVMAALNITHELLQIRREKEEKTAAISEHIQHLQEKIAVAIDSGKQLEL